MWAATRSLERTVSVRLGSCEDPAGAMDELASGDVGLWEDGARRLAEELRRLREERDAAIKAAITARRELKGIEESADIPRFQEQRESLRAELANLVRVHEPRPRKRPRSCISSVSVGRHDKESASRGYADPPLRHPGPRDSATEPDESLISPQQQRGMLSTTARASSSATPTSRVPASPTRSFSAG